MFISKDGGGAGNNWAKGRPSWIELLELLLSFAVLVAAVTKHAKTFLRETLYVELYDLMTFSILVFRLEAIAIRLAIATRVEAIAIGQVQAKCSVGCRQLLRMINLPTPCEATAWPKRSKRTA